MGFQEYFSQIKGEFDGKNATEHTYRPALKNLLESFSSDIRATNEPKRQQCGAPDFVITRKQIPLGYVEAKDIGVDLDMVEKSEQMKRYLESLENLILTDYLEFRFFRNGQKIETVQIGKKESGKLQAVEENFRVAENLIKNFSAFQGQTITSAVKLAKMMANKARLMRDVLLKAVEAEDGATQLHAQLSAFRKILIHDMTAEQFADVYAQTIAYGLFAARLHDDSMETFSRQEAAYLLPKSNPFLRKLFSDIAGIDLDERISWIVDELAELFSYCDVRAILKDFGKGTRRSDPILHFYETFLAEYDPKLRKSRGVYYTPEPVVDFIVRAVDEILKTEFGLRDGLADTAKTEIAVVQQGKKIKKEVHRVQILDPAVGTGTFLNDIIRLIAEKFEGQKGIWQSYVEQHLIPRLHGFELLMASYAMCHLKLDLTLEQSGFDWKKAKEHRLGVYLTNSLEEAADDTGTLFAQWLSNEANEANAVKRETPVMVVIGNPPYSGESANKGKWIMNLMQDYKKEPSGGPLQERNSKWINDDYVKFIRFAESFIERTGEGVLGFITNHSYLDNPTFRGMRWKLLNTFNRLYILDLHGNSKRKEVSPDGSKDENVFDIQQGVSIILGFKNKEKKTKLSEVLHYDLFGMRSGKYEFLNEHSLGDIKFQKLSPENESFFFTNKNLSSQKIYNEGFKINEVFPINSVGIVTAKDNLVIDFDAKSLKKKIEDFFDSLRLNSETEPRSLGFKQIQKNLSTPDHNEYIKNILYRTFDIRNIYYDPKMIERSREKVMNHFLKGNNLGLISVRRIPEKQKPPYIFISNTLVVNGAIRSDSTSIDSVFPLYIYQDSLQESFLNAPERTPNLNPEILKQIEAKLKLRFVPETIKEKDTFSPENLLDYIYAVLHSPTYREKYKEFLKIDFPRIPFVEDKEIFWKLVALGHELREYHLMTHSKIDELFTRFPTSGSGKVEKINFTLTEKEIGKVWINTDQYFENVPKSAWEFYIGGYQPAQKWLKDRKGRVLSFEDILHWQKIIVALNETERLMKEIDEVYKNF